MKEEKIKKKSKEYESKYNYSLAIARHFEDGAKWALSQPQIIEIFGKRVKIVKETKDIDGCSICAFSSKCQYIDVGSLCEDSSFACNRHFVEVDDYGNEIK